MTTIREALEFYADKTNWETVTLDEARKRLGGKDPTTEIHRGRMNFAAPAGKALAPALTDNGDRARSALADIEGAGKETSARWELAMVKAALKLVIEQKAPAYHDCIDAGEPECAWCIARKALSK